jgi:glucuronate isomerase
MRVTVRGLHPDRLFPAEEQTRGIARSLYRGVKDLPLICPHGHTDPIWYARNEPFSDPATLFVKPDHYVFRMLYSQGVGLDALGVPRADGGPTEDDNRAIWRLFARHFHLFRGTPTRLWFEHALEEVFQLTERLNPANADRLYDQISEQLERPQLRPRALYDRFRIEVLSTTDGALDSLEHHDAVLNSGWKGRVLPAYRPDQVIDPEFEGFAQNIVRLGLLTGEDTHSWKGYLAAHRKRRAHFIQRGCTSSDHGHASARTANLSQGESEALFAMVIQGKATPEQCDVFRGQMLTEMARMSLDDGLVMQIHPGSFRNHNRSLFEKFGRDKGADIPTQTDYVRALKPMLDAVGNESRLTIIVFTLDETSYSRELAPLAGHYPALKLGPAWWFFDAPEGMRRFRELTTETAGFYNTVGFNDDTRAFLSIPARHDMARRVDCAFLARLVAEHRMDEDEAHEVAHDLAYRLAREAYKL